MKNICIYGVGGIGGVFGGIFADKISKNNDKKYKVYYIGRGEHLNTIKSKGLVLNLPKEKLICNPTGAEESITKVPSPDLLLLCVKGYDLENALEDISKNIKENTIIVPLLNGVDIYDRIREKLKKAIVLPSCVYIGAHIEKYGEVTMDSKEAKIISGRDPININFNIEELIKFIDFTGINWSVEEDSSLAIWEKYMFIASFGLVTAYSGKTFGGVREDAELTELIKAVSEEIFLISIKKGIKLPVDIVEKTLKKAYNFPYETKTSYQRDVEMGKEKNEGNLFGETIIKLGEETGTDTPFTRKVYYKILNS